MEKLGCGRLLVSRSATADWRVVEVAVETAGGVRRWKVTFESVLAGMWMALVWFFVWFIGFVLRVIGLHQG